jgi:hypothetical protein
MEEQRIVVFLLECVRTAGDALGLEKAVTIGTAKCRAVLPVMGRWPMFLAGPPRTCTYLASQALEVATSNNRDQLQGSLPRRRTLTAILG